MISKRIVLHFPKTLVDRPIISRLVKEYDLEFNILKANITPREEGLLVLELKGKDKSYRDAVDYLKKMGVRVKLVSQDVTRDEDRCTHCGACVTICPTDALVKDTATQEINFNKEECIACELCIPACPVEAMEVRF